MGDEQSYLNELQHKSGCIGSGSAPGASLPDPLGVTVRAGVPRHRNLIFTSAGDHSNLRLWLAGTRKFDLWVTYYGDGRNSYGEAADYYAERKGSKFQNLHFAYRECHALFAQYDYVMAMDDDVIIGADELDRLFDLCKSHDLWACQPAFSPRGRISWPITRVRPTCSYRFTNFIEMTCPIFRQDKLAAFMQVYDPVLVGYGMDWWFLHTMGADLSGKVAVIDEIICVNPHERTKTGVREIDRLQPMVKRQAIWTEVKKKYGIRGEEQGTREFLRIRKPLFQGLWDLLVYSTYAVPIWCRRIPSDVARRLRRKWQEIAG
jgi:hypothetical protein